uniref:Ig-like domain-containing protein n=1 Tax=Salarias fasciatus TaxID=181472 RepID=A0A672FAI2_SALFA
MGTSARLRVCTFLFATVVIAEAASDKKYFKLGGSLVLRPAQVTGDITSVSWKHNKDLVAEWVKDKVPPTFYGVLKDRAKMESTTAVLTITNMTKDNEGDYSAEINDQLQGDAHTVVFLEVVPIPEVVQRPLTCSPSEKTCTLSCHAETKGAEPVTYHWKVGEKDWVKGEKDKEISNTEGEEQPKTFTCRIKNPVSESDSKPSDNPFLRRTSEGGPNGGAIAGGIIVVLVLVLGVGAAVAWFFYPNHPLVSRFRARKTHCLAY